MNAEAHGNFSGKRLVIFGCGYVGAQVADEAIQRGLRVTALTRNEAKAAVLRSKGVDVIVADLADDAWHARIAGSADFALNCVSSGGAGIEGYRRSYLAGMESVLRWALQRGPVGTLLFTSSTSVYPQGEGTLVGEDASTAGAGERGQIMSEVEARVRDSERACVRWFVLRLAGIYGPGRHSLLDQVRSGSVAGAMEGRLNLIYRDDIWAAVWRAFGALPAITNQIFNVADDGAARRAEIVAWLAARLKVPVPRVSDEPPRGHRPSTPDRIISNAKIKAALGWRPGYPTFREGYEKILSLS